MLRAGSNSQIASTPGHGRGNLALPHRLGNMAAMLHKRKSTKTEQTEHRKFVPYRSYTALLRLEGTGGKIKPPLQAVSCLRPKLMQGAGTCTQVEPALAATAGHARRGNQENSESSAPPPQLSFTLACLLADWRLARRPANPMGTRRGMEPTLLLRPGRFARLMSDEVSTAQGGRKEGNGA